MRSGRVQPVLDARWLELAQARAEGAKTLWQGKAVWSVEAASGEWCPQSPTGMVISDTLSGRLHPRMASRALAGCLLPVVAEAPD